VRWRAWLRLAGLVGALGLVAVAAMTVAGRWIARRACYASEAREGSVFVDLIGWHVADLGREWSGAPLVVRHRRTGGEPGVVVDATACAHPGRATVYVS
jgi:hypothetical protein